MNDIQIFSFESKQIRTVMIDGVLYFIGKDVCEYLGDKDHKRSLSRINEEDKVGATVPTPGGNQTMIAVNESGLYSLLFNMQPQKGNGNDVIAIQRYNKIRAFKHWVTSEVLPSIRKTGSFIHHIDSRFLYQVAEELRLKEEKIKELQPKAEFFDAVADSKTAIQIGEVAKLLNIQGIGRNNLFEILREAKVLMKDNIPYQKYVDCGYFRVIEQKWNSYGETIINLKTLVFQTGVDFIRKLLNDKRKNYIEIL